jgi:hypothetical protein
VDKSLDTTEPSDGSKTWVTLREAAEQAGLSVSKVRRWSAAGRIRSRKQTYEKATKRPERRMVVLEDVLAQVEGAKHLDGEPDRRPSNDEPAAPSTVATEPDESRRLMAQLGDLRWTHGEAGAAKERAIGVGGEYDILRQALRELQRRVERLEHLYAAVVDSMGSSAEYGHSTDDVPIPDPDVEVEWRAEEAEEAKEPSRFSFLRRRDHRP